MGSKWHVVGASVGDVLAADLFSRAFGIYPPPLWAAIADGPYSLGAEVAPKREYRLDGRTSAVSALYGEDDFYLSADCRIEWSIGSHGVLPMKLLQLRRQHQDEVHDQLERTAARFAYGVRECPKANSGSVQPLEGAGQFQDRIVRHPGWRLGRVYVDGLRRSAGSSQVLFDAAGF